MLSFLKTLAENADWVGDGLENGVRIWNICGGE